MKDQITIDMDTETVLWLVRLQYLSPRSMNDWLARQTALQEWLRDVKRNRQRVPRADGNGFDYRKIDKHT